MGTGWTLVGLAAAGWAVAAAAWLRGRLTLRPRAWTEPPRDALILAAHPDDDAIVAGEYGVLAARAGRRIEVLFLTCGDRAPDTRRARTRLDEAVRAWGSLGVPAQQVRSLALVNSPLAGPSRLGAPDLERAGLALEDAIRRLPRDAAVFVPAAGEAHADHRTLRDLALGALARVARPDLLVLEAPTYNPYLSLSRCPGRALRYVAEQLPLLARLRPAPRVQPPAAFPTGGPPRLLPPDPERLRAKCDLLRAYASEDGERLVALFGHPDRYRPVPDPAAARGRTPRGYVPIRTRRLGPSLLALWLGIDALTLAAFHTAARWAQQGGLPAALLWAALAALGALLGLRLQRRRIGIEQALLVLCALVGLLLALLRG